MVQWINPLILLPEQSGGVGSIPGRALPFTRHDKRGEWPSGLYSLRQVTEVKLGRVRSDFGCVTP